MRAWDVLRNIADSGLVAVVRAESPAQAERIAEACAEGGVAAIEIAFTTPGAASVIERLARSNRILAGAGTVLDPETARIATLAGAQYIVSPSLHPATARLCNRYQVPYLPGAMTLREIVEAMECGAGMIKLFPGEALGPEFVKAVRAPLPQAPLMPTGGVSLDNVAAWIKAGCVAVGVGGNLTAPAKNGDYAAITKIAREFIARIGEARA
ncbi:MAG TPA: bifunctional 2-keto-4-hydroxyglutarate aldolase/2-keto-3-deoxy-6-phosphogluconate aldolase [Bryobacteraceae bacterium]|jgi:2-dehydro-3-deoxyphosphogluconate aldolase/(4S)-4-hydroxy-2-oxoglutarate aldolase|nr:bifunctional 2-keto-4-hydroxyglutarate aldolase/2-keto-3-deoxy-6-phosphogluconate aldolase [Bryobacteraceae bacterium]